MKWLKTLVAIATLMAIQQTQASYQFFDNQEDFVQMMEQPYYTDEVIPKNGTVTFDYEDYVSGFGGTFGSAVTVKIYNGPTLASPNSEYIGFITGEPFSSFIESITFAGDFPTDFKYGMDIVTPVPEPSTYLAGIGALGILAMSFRRKAV
ncbi:MAG TPA: PEP-CTERM sorting domain-containing protein [Candidatus Paceibacterota bacterium]|nr:PEP-CTERM sorting domain-containing protein [Candidatus Paceibacterota bacterium]